MMTVRKPSPPFGSKLLQVANKWYQEDNTFHQTNIEY